MLAMGVFASMLKSLQIPVTVHSIAGARAVITVITVPRGDTVPRAITP